MDCNTAEVLGCTEKMQTYDLDNKEFLEIDISRRISGAQKQMLMYSTNLAVIVMCEGSVLQGQFGNNCIAR